MELSPPLKLTVPSLWDLLGDLRQQIYSHLKEVDDDAREAAVMAASELIENAIKYGRSAKDALPASLILECTDVIKLTITSSIRSAEAARQTLDRIEAINRAPDRLALYESRMEELMAKPFKGSSSQLGLLRIAGEGNFELHAEMVGADMLRITATRSLK